MQLNKAISNITGQLAASLQQLTDGQYSQPSNSIFTATIGQHVRHVIELFTCMHRGYETGVVNYEKRKRDHRIENDKAFAIQLLLSIAGALKTTDRNLVLESNYDENSDEVLYVQTNYYRELIYTLEHAVHHMALIRVGINEVSDIELPDDFGVASSTLKFRKTCAQ